MCDFVRGELLACYRHGDTVASYLFERMRGRQYAGFRLIETLVDKLSQHRVTSARKSLRHDFVRLGVTPGAEVAGVNELQGIYHQLVLDGLTPPPVVGARPPGPPALPQSLLDAPGERLQVGLNSQLTVCAKAKGKAKPVGKPTFTPDHASYQSLIGWPGPRSSVRKQVLILDTGVYPAHPFNVVEEKNLLDTTSPFVATDDNNHGSAVAAIINDLCPRVELLVYKVADQKGQASEWDLLAGLAADNTANVLNISLTFGLRNRKCPRCGRASRSSRSAVFEKLLADLQADEEVVVVASAGNQTDSELAYPARFSNVIAVESVNRAGELSDFTNRSDQDHSGALHPNVFVMPGGQRKPAEYALSGSDGTEHFGTSFAAAYASALVAAVWSNDPKKTAAEIVDDLTAAADTSKLPKYTAKTHGNGLLQYV